MFIVKSIYESKDDTIIVQKRLTRWQSALTLEDNQVTPTQITLWSEEFMTTNCC